MNTDTIEKKIPVLAVENGVISSKFGDITIPLQISLPEVFTLSEIDFENIHNAWVRALKSLPEFTIIHKQDLFLENRYTPGFSPSSSFLEKASQLTFKNKPYLEHTCNLYITKTTKKKMRGNSLFSSLCRTRIIPESVNKREITAFTESVESLIHILQQNGISVNKLTTSDILGEKNTSGILDKYLSLNYDSMPVLKDISYHDQILRVGDSMVSIYSITDTSSLPDTLSTHIRHPEFSTDKTEFNIGPLFPITFNIKCNHIVNQYIFIENHNEVKTELEKTSKKMNSLSSVSKENVINREYNEEFINESIIHSRKCVRAAINILIWDEHEENLRKKGNIISASLSNMECTPKQSKLNAFQIFWAGIPGAASEYPYEETFLTFMEQACCLFNNEGDYRSSEIGVTLTDRIYGRPVRVHLYDPAKCDNGNKVIIGPSGSGKSFFTNHMVRQYYEQGAHILMVDTGNSYLPLCNVVSELTNKEDGIYFTYSEENPVEFNPFYSTEYNYDIERRDNLKTLIISLWKGEKEIASKAEETHLETAISGYIAWIKSDKQTRPCFNTFYEYLKKDFTVHIKKIGVETGNFDLQNMLQILAPFYRGGTYDYLLNSQKDLDLQNKRFIVFELDNIKDHKVLFPIVTIIIMDTFINKMRQLSPDTRKVILIEEAWKAISTAGTAAFIRYLYKTVRKYNGEVVTVTQEIDDIIGNEIVKDAIINSADWKILLDQRKYQQRFDDIKNILGLSDSSVPKILSINNALRPGAKYKEVAICVNGKVNDTQVYGVEVSPYEYACYTTTKQERGRLEDLVKKTGSWMQAISEFVNTNK